MVGDRPLPPRLGMSSRRDTVTGGGGMLVRFGLMVLVVLVMPSMLVEGLIVHNKAVSPSHWQVNGHHTLFETFGFDNGGIIKISGTLGGGRTANAFIYICDQNEQQTKLRNDQWINFLCGDRTVGYKCPLTGEVNTITVPKNFYYFSVIDCSDYTTEAFVNYTLLSTKDGNQLSYDEIPLPVYYVSVLGAWVLILLVWSFDIYRNISLRSPLHTITWAVILLKIFIVTLITFYWWVYSNSGHCYETLNTLQNFLFSFSETAFFAVVYLISKGWRIIRSGLPAAEVRSTFIALLVLLATLLFFSFYNTEYYWLSLILLYFFMLPKIFTSLTQNMRLLDSQMVSLRRGSRGVLSPDMDRLMRLLKAKRDVFRKVRTCLVGYLILMLLVNSLVRVLLVWEVLWVSRVANESIVLIMVVYVIVRLRPSLGMFYVSREEMWPLLALQALQTRGFDGLEDEAEREEEWDVSKTLVVLWPWRGRKGKSGKEATKGTKGVNQSSPKDEDLTRMPLSLAYEVDYVQLLKGKEVAE